MGRLLLNGIYLGLIFLALPLLLYRRWTKGKYQGGWQEKFLGRVPARSGDAPCLWLHAVSVGEVLQLQPIIEGWKASHPDWDIYISTTTGTGRQVAEKHYPDCVVCYCPLDFTWSVREAFRRIRPTCFALVELELWPNLIWESKVQQVKCVLINGRLSAKSFRGYQKIQRILRPLWRCFSLVAVQNEEYADRFRQLGVSEQQLLRAGSIKFDRLKTERNSEPVQSLKKSFGIEPGQIVFMAGSTHAPEEEIALNVWERLKQQQPNLKLLLAPRHAERFEEVSQLIEKKGFAAIRRTSVLSSGLPSLPANSPAVYLLDTLGELSHAWGLADFAYVGGSLNQRGGQNMMEPAAYGTPVLFGPNTWNFAEVVSSLKQAEACFEIHDENELANTLSQLLNNDELSEKSGKQAQNYVMSQQGGTPKTLSAMEQLLGLDRARQQGEQNSSRAA